MVLCRRLRLNNVTKERTISKKIIIVLSLLFFVPLLSASAGTIILKSGKTVEGKILEKTDKSIKVDIDGIAITYYLDEIANIKNTSSDDSLPHDNQTAIIPQGSSQEPGKNNNIFKIPINPMVELDFKTKDEIYAMRKEAVLRYAQLAPGNYTPLDAVFGQIESNKPWWGMVGQAFFGPGQKGIVGPSEESRFLMNPFLLVGLSDVNAYIIDDKSLSPQGNYPIPTRLVWDKDDAVATVTYDITSYLKIAKRYHYQCADTRAFELIAYNARDLGFNYMYNVPEKSKNVLSKQGSPVALGQYIHCGGSCGYPGGCNNMSPEQEVMQINIDQTPATLYIKLWKSTPLDSGQPADMVFIIEMI